MSFLDFGAEDAARAASQAQQTAAKKQRQATNKYESKSEDEIRAAGRYSADQITEAEAQALQFRAQAGEALTAAEQQALAEYSASQGLGLDTLGAGQTNALNALQGGATQGYGYIDEAQAGGLDALGRSRDDIGRGYQEGLGYIDSAETAGLNALAASRGQAEGYYQPYYETGTAAQNEIAALQGLLGPEAQAEARARFQTDPGYQFRVSEGLAALDRSATARGGLYSGAAMKAVNDYAQGQAAQEYGNYYNRTAGIANTGFNAAANLADLARQYGMSEAELRSRLGLERAGLAERSNQNLANLGVTEAELRSRLGLERAGVAERLGSQSAGVYGDTAARSASLIGDFGARRGATIGDMGIARSNVLTGSGDVAMQTGRSLADTALGFTNAMTNMRGNALMNRNNALANQGDAVAAGHIGAANARQAGFSNALTLGSAALRLGGSFL